MTLTDELYDALRAEAHLTGLSQAELVRRALEVAFPQAERPRVRGWDVRFGIWRRPDAAVAGRRTPLR